MAKIVYGIVDVEMGEVYAISSTDPCSTTVRMTENFTWEESDFTDPKTGKNYICLDRLAEIFNDLCKRSGMKKHALAARCGKNPATFSRYCSGISPVPELVWREVERIADHAKR